MEISLQPNIKQNNNMITGTYYIYYLLMLVYSMTLDGGNKYL